MECLQIDWKNIDAIYEKDEFYESIQAPKWIDFTVPLQPVDDHAWFCGKVGCTHEKKKVVVQAVNQESKASKASANKVAPPAAMTASASFGGKKARGLVSSSLSSLSEIKAAYSKNEVLNHTQMPSISETKSETTRNARRQQASENENPNRAGKFQGGACKNPIMIGALEGIAKNAKVLESKGNAGKKASAHVPNGEIPTCGFTKASSTLAEQVNLSQTGPILEASKSTFIFGKRHPMHSKSTLDTVFDKDPTSYFSSISEGKIKKAEGKHPFSRPLPAARNPRLTASLAMPIRRSAANAKPLHGMHIGNDKVATCKQPRVPKDVRVTVHAHACRKKNDHKEELFMVEGILQKGDPLKDKEMQMNHTAKSPRKQELCLPVDELEIDSKENDVLALTASRHGQHTQREVKEEQSICGVEPSVQPMMQEQEMHSVDKQLLHSLQGGEEEDKANNTIQTREKEDSIITNTLEKFLENLQLTSNEDESISDLEHSASKQDMAHANQADCVAELDSVQSHHVDNSPEHEMMSSHCVDCAMEQDTEQTHHVDCSTERNRVKSHHEVTALEQEMVPSMRCSPHIDELSHMCTPLSSQDGTTAMPMTRDDTCINDKMKPLMNSEEQLKKTKQEEDSKIAKDWQRHRARKRKSSELNFKVNCSSRDHKHETQTVPSTGGLVSQLLKQSSSTAKSLMIAPAAQPHRFKEPCEEHHKRMKATIVQAFKPFRLRTEERGVLKELGLGRKELTVPNSKETVHHALRMPSFGHPFRPQRSTKKLTIPREPKFHASKTRKACTSHATDLASS